MSHFVYESEKLSTISLVWFPNKWLYKPFLCDSKTYSTIIVAKFLYKWLKWAGSFMWIKSTLAVTELICLTNFYGCFYVISEAWQFPIFHFHCMKNSTRNNALNSFCVPQNTESHTSLKQTLGWLNDDNFFYFAGNYFFKRLQVATHPAGLQ